MSQVFQILGFAASVIVALGYLPQIAHLARQRCAMGISVGAWWLWGSASLFFFLYALSVADWVISTFAAIQLAAAVTITALATRYRGERCARCRALDHPSNHSGEMTLYARTRHR